MSSSFQPMDVLASELLVLQDRTSKSVAGPSAIATKKGMPVPPPPGLVMLAVTTAAAVLTSGLPSSDAMSDHGAGKAAYDSDAETESTAAESVGESAAPSAHLGAAHESDSEVEKVDVAAWQTVARCFVDAFREASEEADAKSELAHKVPCDSDAETESTAAPTERHFDHENEPEVNVPAWRTVAKCFADVFREACEEAERDDQQAVAAQRGANVGAWRSVGDRALRGLRDAAGEEEDADAGSPAAWRDARLRMLAGLP